MEWESSFPMEKRRGIGPSESPTCFYFMKKEECSQPPASAWEGTPRSWLGRYCVCCWGEWEEWEQDGEVKASLCPAHHDCMVAQT